MASPKFLFDECTDPALRRALIGKAAAIDILTVGGPGAPPKATQDPELLIASEFLVRVLVTNDRQTMPGHLADHFQAGLHTWGTILLRRGSQIGDQMRDLLLIWQATTADEWRDRIDYIPY
jgi:hypothetical protein